MPTISVVLGTFNGSEFLQQQLDCYVSQTRRPDQLVVGDDGSTDDTLDILDRFATIAPFPVSVHEGPRCGLAANFLSAAQRAEGDLIAFSDQDDVWLDRKLETAERALVEARAGLVFHGVQAVDVRLRPVRTRAQPRSRRQWEPCQRNVWVPLAGNTMLVAKRVVAACDWENPPTSQWYPGARVNHDEYVSLVAAVSETSLRLPDRLLLYRQHGGNAAGAREAGVPPSSWSRGSYIDYVRHRAAAARDWEQSIVPGISPELRPQATAYFRRSARAQDRRAAVLDAPVIPAAGLWAAHTLAGDYRLSSPSGLGWRAFFRDGYHLSRRIAKR